MRLKDFLSETDGMVRCVILVHGAEAAEGAGLNKAQALRDAEDQLDGLNYQAYHADSHWQNGEFISPNGTVAIEYY